MPLSSKAGKPKTLEDPVCGMKITDLTKLAAEGKVAEYRGTTYYFCSDDCKNRFQKHPEHYLTANHPEGH
jgi:Cu+-exporting ATPase